MDCWKTIERSTGEQTRAMELPHGVLILHEQWADQASESMVFVPGLAVELTCEATSMHKIVPK